MSFEEKSGKRKEENVKIKGGKTKGKGQSEVQRVK
jgi:hypothetical protein